MVLQPAKEQGVAEAYSEAAFRAFFQQNRNIGEDDVILSVAESAGLDRADVISALASEDRRQRQLEDQELAVGTFGVSMVPSFRINGQLAPGVMDVERLTQLVDEAEAQKVEP